MADLTLNITETLDLEVGGTPHVFTTSDGTDDLNVSGINGYLAQTISIPTTAGLTQVIKFGSTSAIGQVNASNFKYMRFYNAGNTNVTVQLSDSTANKQINFLMVPNQPLFFTSLNFDNNSSTSTASDDVIQGTSNVSGTSATADEVRMISASSANNVDVFVAYS
jgi:hypothetical protein